MTLNFEKAITEKHFKAVYDYNIDAFSDTPDFKWTLSGIIKEVKDGWELFSVKDRGEIVAAVFIKKVKKSLLSKNTAVKLEHQGQGYNHQIKEFIEEIAFKRNIVEIFHYCRIDNFRMYSLNESHKYKKTTGNKELDEHVVEWIKKLK